MPNFITGKFPISAALVLSIVTTVAGFSIVFNTVFSTSNCLNSDGTFIRLKNMQGLIKIYEREKHILPKNIKSLIKDEFLNEVPTVNLGSIHQKSNLVLLEPFILDDGVSIDEKLIKDSGHWMYDSKYGVLIIDCSHALESDYKNNDGKKVYRW